MLYSAVENSKTDLRRALNSSVLRSGCHGHWIERQQESKIEHNILLGIFNVNMPLLYGKGEKLLRTFKKRLSKVAMTIQFLHGA
jgi:hypothetical protein